jgi:lysozyme
MQMPEIFDSKSAICLEFPFKLMVFFRIFESLTRPVSMRIVLRLMLFMFFLHSCELETKRMRGYEVHGIDVSHYQSIINWDLVAQQQVDFVFVKATEGETFTDSMYCINWNELERLGMRRGAYHFYRPGVPAELQAANFISEVSMQAGDLPPVLDVEVMEGSTARDLVQGIRTWMYLVESHFKIRPILYSNLRFYQRFLAGHFVDYPVWIARYNTLVPHLGDEKTWAFWQYGNRGRMDGIEGHVDFNVFHGSLLQLDELCLNPPPVLSLR